MPQLNPLVLKDQASPQVSHTFNPRDVTAGIATLAESAGVPLGESRITFATNRATSGRVRVTIKLSVPVVQDATVNGVTRPTVVRTSYVDMTFNFDGSSSLKERQDIIGFICSLTGKDQAMVQGVLADLQGLY